MMVSFIAWLPCVTPSTDIMQQIHHRLGVLILCFIIITHRLGRGWVNNHQSRRVKAALTVSALVRGPEAAVADRGTRHPHSVNE
jgi:hypothetical protein